MGAISRQKLEIPYHQKNTLILYEESERSRAIALAKEFRLAKKPTELVKNQMTDFWMSMCHMRDRTSVEECST